MEVSLPYGESTLRAELPGRALVIRQGGGGRSRLEPAADQGQAVRDALAAPLGMPPLRELVRPGSRVVIAFDDGTVSTAPGVRRVLVDVVLEELESAGVAESDVTLLCANALHRKWTRDELSKMLGADLVQRFC